MKGERVADNEIGNNEKRQNYICKMRWDPRQIMRKIKSTKGEGSSFHRMSRVFVTTSMWPGQIYRLNINISVTCSIKNKLLECDMSVYPTAITKLSDYIEIHQIHQRWQCL